MVAGLAAAVAVARFLFGLGATTNLTDANPWGVWIGFDVMSGVALAAGGFVITATVYIFKLERFHSIVRPAVLTAFLGYAAVAVGLLFDLGLPWNIWHMIVFWNPHSPLFEVGWCVMLYLTVLSLEFFPVPAEEFSALAKARRLLIKIRLPLVIAGIGLSTLHQSSLGSLFLIMPYRLHPLWYSPILPVMFFISAIGLGLMMVMFESHFTAYMYRRKPETGLLASLGGAARWVLILYLAVRFGDLAVRGQLAHLADATWQCGMFWFEIAAMAVFPAVLLSIPRVRRNRGAQWAVAALGVSGVVLNRIDVGGLTHLGQEGTFYLPAWTEIAISAGVISAAVLVFLFAIEHFKVWEERPADPDAEPLKLPEFDRVGTTWLGTPAIAARTTYSLGFILAAAIGFAFLSAQPAASRGMDPTPVHQARGGEILWIDGNLDGNGVAFKHEEHEKREGAKASCVKCHHMNLPRDKNTACYRCHSDMYLPSDAFRHDWHRSPTGARVACYQCHPTGQVRSAATAKRCDQCHKDLIPAGATIPVKRYKAVSYTEAMHRLCIGCHAQKAVEKNKPEMARCAWCHKEGRDVIDARDLVLRRRGLIGKNMVLPPIGK
jgi:Ni/Fe-hydrogenase subunit HybB-like protein